MNIRCELGMAELCFPKTAETTPVSNASRGSCHSQSRGFNSRTPELLGCWGLPYVIGWSRHGVMQLLKLGHNKPPTSVPVLFVNCPHSLTCSPTGGNILGDCGAFNVGPSWQKQSLEVGLTRLYSPQLCLIPPLWTPHLQGMQCLLGTKISPPSFFLPEVRVTAIVK